MVLLLEKLSRSLRFPSRLDNHPQNCEAVPASFHAFESKISSSLHNLLLYSWPGSEFLSLAFVSRCLGLLPLINKAFAKLVVDLDYPVGRWEAATVEAYLRHSLNMLELLNSVSACLSHLSHDRLSLLHSLSLIGNSSSLAASHLKRIQPKDVRKQFKMEGLKKIEGRGSSDKESAVSKALLVMKSISFWVFGIILSGLCSDDKPYIEMKKLAGGFDECLLRNMDSKVSNEIMEKRGELKEVEDVNTAAEGLMAALGTRKGDTAAIELRTRLEILEKLLQGVEKETGHLFAETLAARNKVLDSFRLSDKNITD